MALNIPVNLMNTAAPPIQPSVANDEANTTAVTAVQPTSGSATTHDTASDGGGMNRESAQQQALIFQQRATLKLATTPDKAEPKSIVAAQTGGTEPAQPAEQTKAKAPDAPRQSELDRYAPPNPLPTAPILQLAASYAALTKQED